MIANPYLLGLDERAGALVSGVRTEKRLNRYSLLWLGHPASAPDHLSVALTTLCRQRHEPATWCYAWRADAAGISPSFLRWMRTQLTKSGWTLASDGLLEVAVRPFDEEADQFFHPSGYAPRLGGLLLLFGESMSGNALLSDPLRNSVDSMAKTRRFTPSAEFLSWLSNTMQSVAYTLIDNVGHSAFVVLTPQRLSIENLRCAEIHEGSDAGQVWQYGTIVDAEEDPG